MQYYGDHPISSWLGILANPDSAMSSQPQGGKSGLTASTQAQRGQMYTQAVNWYLNAQVSGSVPGVGGVKPYVGLRWWAYIDASNEGANWGLVTPLDNAYDGKEAVMAAGTDPWGYKTGGEAANYGDFISVAKAANFVILQFLLLLVP
jgi:hypothetical protein